MIEKNKIYLGDCFDVMQSIEDKSINLILSDPPYGVTKCSTDVSFPLDLLWVFYKRIIKDNGVIVLFGQGKFSAKLILSNEKMYRYSLVWDKGRRGSGFLNARIMPLRNHEDILIFYKKTPVYNPQFSVGEPLHGMGKKYKEGGVKNNNYGYFKSGENPSAERVGDTKKYPLSILRFDKPHPPIHPTQKPITLGRYLVRTYTNEGDLMLDNFCGSGSFILSAILENRMFIGIEKDQRYYNMSIKRMNDWEDE